MSIPLPDTDLSTLAVGQSTTVDFKNLAITANPAFINNAGTIRMHNESGSGLLITMRNDNASGNSFNLPAGGWVDAPVQVGMFGLSVRVKYIISSPPVQLLLITYYAPNETIPPMTVLGNSPIAGTTNVVSGQIFFTTPVSLITNGSLNNSTITVQATGTGGIPSSATGVLCNLYFTASNLGAFVSITPHGIVWNTSANYPIVGTAQTTTQALGGSFIVPVDVNGKLDVTSISNCSGVYMSAYGYIQ